MPQVTNYSTSIYLVCVCVGMCMSVCVCGIAGCTLSYQLLSDSK